MTSPRRRNHRASAGRLINANVNILTGKIFSSDVPDSTTEPGNPPSHITDGQMNTRWISQPTSPVNATVDMAGIYNLSRVTIVWAADTIRNYRIDISTNGTVWSTIATGVTNNTQSQTITHTSFSAAAQGRYLRITGTDRWNAGYGNSIWEAEAYGVLVGTVPTGTIISFSGVATSDTTLTLTWGYSGSTLANYTLTRNGSTIATPAAGATSYNDSGLTAGTNYSYSLTGNFQAGGTTSTVSASVRTTGGSLVEQPGSVWPIRVSNDGHFLVDANGAPFMWQADTAWSLCCRLTQAETQYYLDTRLAQGYNVIQMSPFFYVNGYNQTNRNGDPMFNGDFPNFNENYMQHVDWVVDQIEQRGMYCAMFAVWSVMYACETNPHKLTTGNSAQVGTYFGNRYKTKKIIWVMGGDCGFYETAIWNPMAQAIVTAVAGTPGDYSKTLMTFHSGATIPGYDTNGSSSGGYHSEPWLDFNASESTHCDTPPRPRSYDLMSYDYGLSPAKPTVDGESTYEDHPRCWNAGSGFFNDTHARSANWTAVFAGAFGFTYGHHSVWPFVTSTSTNYLCTWQQALTQRPAGAQMQYLRKLLESRPILSRVPDQSIITSTQGSNYSNDWTRKQACRGSDGSYIFVYNTTNTAVTVNTSKLSSTNAHVWWYNPRTGVSNDAGVFTLGGLVTFTPPSSGDWCLVLDDTSKNYGTPGVSPY
ncbi:DUF4038 domain-containing protein [Candidatus Saccharibacteria bacterium]|nr:MAG: DUF4038 domain-containing protein [Candidatus Saccharibacteria bacterium]